MIRSVLKVIECLVIPFYASYLNFLGSISNRVTFFSYVKFRLSFSKLVYWPVHKNSEVTHPHNIFVGINSNPGTRPGCYIQGNGGIFIGNYVRVASNVGIISGNHDLYNHALHNNMEVYINDYCWIGMNSVILPGVVLGKRTIVAAGSVVTKSFPDGFCVIGGNPAKIIKLLDSSKFVPTKFKSEYYGYISKDKFEQFLNSHLINNKYRLLWKNR